MKSTHEIASENNEVPNLVDSSSSERVDTSHEALHATETSEVANDANPRQRHMVNSPYMTTREAAAYLRKSESWIMRRRDIPYLAGKPNTYHRRDLDNWFEQSKRQMF